MRKISPLAGNKPYSATKASNTWSGTYLGYSILKSINIYTRVTYRNYFKVNKLESLLVTWLAAIYVGFDGIKQDIGILQDIF